MGGVKYAFLAVDPKYGVVRHIARDGDYAAQFDDLNSDYREVCLTVLRHRGGAWEWLASQDDAGYPQQGSLAYFDLGNVAGAAGRGDPDEPVLVRCLHEERQLRTDTEGCWLFVCEADTTLDKDPWAHLRSFRRVDDHGLHLIGVLLLGAGVLSVLLVVADRARAPARRH
jgi:hypothetical protein